MAKNRPFEVTCCLNKERFVWKGKAKNEKQAKAILVSEVARVLGLAVRPYVTDLKAKSIDEADIKVLGGYLDVRSIPRQKKAEAQLRQLSLF